MTPIASELKSKLAALPINDRAELALFLIGSLDLSTEADAATAWDAELYRRHEDIMSGRAVGEPAEQVFAKLREKFA